MNIAIVGLGSVLMGDDAAGPYLLKVLEARHRFPPEVSLVDAGTPGPGLIDLLAGYDHLLIVDAVRSQAPPGSVRVYRREEILRHPPNLRLSPHDPNLKEALLEAELAGESFEEVALVGVVPERVELGTSLSETVQAALPEAEAAVLDELRRLGVDPERREPAAELAIWWQK